MTVCVRPLPPATSSTISYQKEGSQKQTRGVARLRWSWRPTLRLPTPRDCRAWLAQEAGADSGSGESPPTASGPAAGRYGAASTVSILMSVIAMVSVASTGCNELLDSKDERKDRRPTARAAAEPAAMAQCAS